MLTCTSAGLQRKHDIKVAGARGQPEVRCWLAADALPLPTNQQYALHETLPLNPAKGTNPTLCCGKLASPTDFSSARAPLRRRRYSTLVASGAACESPSPPRTSTKQCCRADNVTANLSTKTLDVRGFDPSRLLFLRCGIPRSTGGLPIIVEPTNLSRDYRSTEIGRINQMALRTQLREHRSKNSRLKGLPRQPVTNHCDRERLLSDYA